MITEHGDGGSENDTDYSSNSFRSTSTPTRNAKKKIRKIKKIVADNQVKAHSDRSEEVRLRIHAKIEEQKAAVLSKETEQERETRPVDSSTASSIMLSLSEDIEEMELEAQKLMEELERAKVESAKPKQRKLIKEGFDLEFLESRITELEVENEILTTRLQSGQATVDSIRADISSMANSNQEYKKALREAKEASGPLQVEQENLRSQLQKADEDLQALEARVKYKRTAKKVEKDQKEIFEQAAREILDLQRNHRLKKQISQRKVQQKQQKQKQQQQQQQQQTTQVQQPNPLPQQMQTKPLEREIKRQSSWWQLDTPEKAAKKAVSVKNIHAISSLVSEDVDILESESSDIDTVSEGSGRA
mmetsp:Transcript_7872/g.16340  ORF Transcript_7872/g.16340 Transcript_7872/m.16340 type:complete len:361 (-) Transcript_7872:553-1635(-)